MTRGRFSKDPGANLVDPETDFDIKVSRKVGRVLTSNAVYFVSLADTFIVQFLNLLKLPLELKTKQLNGPGNYRELRETGPRALFLESPKNLTGPQIHIFIQWIFKDREVYKPDTSCIKRAFDHDHIKNVFIKQLCSPA